MRKLQKEYKNVGVFLIEVGENANCIQKIFSRNGVQPGTIVIRTSVISRLTAKLKKNNFVLLMKVGKVAWNVVSYW